MNFCRSKIACFPVRLLLTMLVYIFFQNLFHAELNPICCCKTTGFPEVLLAISFDLSLFSASLLSRIEISLGEEVSSTFTTTTGSCQIPNFSGGKGSECQISGWVSLDDVSASSVVTGSSWTVKQTNMKGPYNINWKMKFYLFVQLIKCISNCISLALESYTFQITPL